MSADVCVWLCVCLCVCVCVCECVCVYVCVVRPISSGDIIIKFIVRGLKKFSGREKKKKSEKAPSKAGRTFGILFLNFSIIKNDFFAAFIKLIWRGLFKYRTGAKIGY